jgi:hypothetical protein
VALVGLLFAFAAAAKAQEAPSAGSLEPPEPVQLPAGAAGWADSGFSAIRGVTVGPIESVQQPGRGYGTDTSARLLDHLVRMGVNWVSVTPFGRIWDLRSTHIEMDFEAPYEHNRRAVRTMIRQARARGLRVLLVPHLWVETGGWRGEIDPGDEAAWQRYRESYRRFLLAWARDAARAGADALSIGVECKSWSGRYGPYWSQLIDEVRSVFPGLLTYSANWDEATDVIFWDRLDLVGINAFYPLSDHENASYAEYVAGAHRVRDRLREVAALFDKPILFVEVGYTTRRDAAVEPWLWPDHMDSVVVDEREQARALSAVFDAFVAEPWFAGFFIWRYYANIDDVSQEAIWGFSPHAKMAEPLLEDVFRGRFGADPPPWPWAEPSLQLPPSYPFAGLFRVPGTRARD